MLRFIIAKSLLFMLCSGYVNAQHIVVPGYFETSSEAFARCEAFAASIPYGTDNCHAGGNPPLIEVGWIVGESGDPFYLGTFYYGVVCPEDKYLDPDLGCIDKDDDECPKDGNPIVILTGKKTQIETDFTSTQSPLEFSRYYSSTAGWLFSFNNRRLTISLFWEENSQTFHNALAFNRSSGQSTIFKGNDSLGYKADSDVAERAGPVLDDASAQTGWYLILEDDTVETYDMDGRLLSITSRKGQVTTLVYDDVLFTTTVTDVGSGDRLILQFSSAARELLSKMTDSQGRDYFYSYNMNNMLETVTYPDETLDSLNDPIRTYHYEDTNNTLLTGITDELGVRYASWVYDTKGRAISSEHVAPSGVDKVTIDYAHIDNEVAPYVTVTNELGQETKYHYDSINGVRKVTLVERSAHINSDDASVSCVSANNHTTYDTHGYKDLVTDWEGNVTDYNHDDRGLEVSRVEAQRWQGDVIDSVVVSSAATRTITTEWHPDFRLPTKITEPDRVTVMTYDPENGRELSRTEYAVGSEP